MTDIHVGCKNRALCWNDDILLRSMIELFLGSSTSAISQQVAYAIDSAVGGVGMKGNASVAKQMKQEINKTMYFSIEF